MRNRSTLLFWLCADLFDLAICNAGRDLRSGAGSECGSGSAGNAAVAPLVVGVTIALLSFLGRPAAAGVQATG